MLNLVAIPVSMLVKALFDRDSFVQTLFSFIILVLGTWGFITLAIFVVEEVLSITWLKIGLPLAGIALAALVFAILFGSLFIIFRRERKSPAR